jgi:hypothetical protein
MESIQNSHHSNSFKLAVAKNPEATGTPLSFTVASGFTLGRNYDDRPDVIYQLLGHYG